MIAQFKIEKVYIFEVATTSGSHLCKMHVCRRLWSMRKPPAIVISKSFDDIDHQRVDHVQQIC